MDEKLVYLANITCECPHCDKLFEVQRYVEQFKPIKESDCRITCSDCIIKAKSSTRIYPVRQLVNLTIDYIQSRKIEVV